MVLLLTKATNALKDELEGTSNFSLCHVQRLKATVIYFYAFLQGCAQYFTSCSAKSAFPYIYFVDIFKYSSA